MEQRLSVLTLAADNFDAMTAFYESIFGWKPVASNEYIVFYKLNGFLFSLIKRSALAGFIGADTQGSGFRSIVYGYIVQTKAEVLRLYTELTTKGVTIVKEPTHPPFGGVYFCFKDIEGNLFEVTYNDHIPLDERGYVVDHKPITD